MRRMNAESSYGHLVVGLFLIGSFLSGACSAPPPAQPPPAPTVTVFEGARLIVGDGSAPIENAAFIVDGDRFTQVGRAGELQVPAGAARVDLTGKTVMPAIIDTHTHLASHARGARRPLAAQGVLRRRRGDEPGPGHGRRAVPGARGDHPQRRAVPHRRARDHDAGARPHRSAVLGDDRSRGAEGRPGAGRPESRHRQDLGRRSGRQVQEADARPSMARSSTRLTRAGSASPRTSSRSRMRRGCCARDSTPSRTACGTRTSTTRSLALFKERPKRRRSCRTCRIAESRRI